MTGYFPYERSPLVAYRSRRKDSLHALPALLPHGRGPGRLLLHSEERRRQALFFWLWHIDRLRHRSDREKTAESFPTRHRSLELRHSRLQLGVPLLPELEHQQG